VVKGEKKVALLRRADMMVIPTSQENFGLVFPEALCCETPVLLTEGVDIHREILEAGGGLLIRRDAADIARQVEALLQDQGDARRRGQAGRAWVYRTLEPSLIARQWIETYERIAGKRPATANVP
jgi:glycosyltransferase involved in cell wall biosynthesis